MLRLPLIACAALLVAACAGWLGDSPSGATGEEKDRGPDAAPDLSHLEEPEPRDEPLSRYGNPATYEVFGRQYEVMASRDAQGFSEEGIASWYGKKFHGRRTSSGEPYDMYTLTAAHTQLPLPTYVRVTNLDNGKSVIVRVNDRGPFARDRVIDLSYAAADRIDMLDAGTAPVRIEALSVAYDPDAAAQADDRPAEREAAVPRQEKPSSNTAITAAGRDLPERPQAESEPGASNAATGDRRAGEQLLLQVGAFSEHANAEAKRNRLSDNGIGAVTILEQGGTYRVRVGPAESREALDALEEALRDAGFDDTYIVTEH